MFRPTFQFELYQVESSKILRQFSADQFLYNSHFSPSLNNAMLVDYTKTPHYAFRPPGFTVFVSHWRLKSTTIISLLSIQTFLPKIPAKFPTTPAVSPNAWNYPTILGNDPLQVKKIKINTRIVMGQVYTSVKTYSIQPYFKEHKVNLCNIVVYGSVVNTVVWQILFDSYDGSVSPLLQGNKI